VTIGQMSLANRSTVTETASSAAARTSGQEAQQNQGPSSHCRVALVKRGNKTVPAMSFKKRSSDIFHRYGGDVGASLLYINSLKCENTMQVIGTDSSHQGDHSIDCRCQSACKQQQKSSTCRKTRTGLHERYCKDKEHEL
jgi:hypothetical protein